MNVFQCLWKGEPILCSRVFTLTPTDQGMCCRFDINQRSSVFTQNNFTQKMEELQGQDRAQAFDSQSLPDPGSLDTRPEVGRYKVRSRFGL